MPIYEYKCDCGHKEEILSTPTKYTKEIPCVKCGKKMKIKISRTSFTFK